MKRTIILTLMTLLSCSALFSQNIFDDKLKRELYAFLEENSITTPVNEFDNSVPIFQIINLITNKNVFLESEDFKYGVYGFRGTVVGGPFHILLKNEYNYEIFEMNDPFNDHWVTYEDIMIRLFDYFKRNKDLNKGFLLEIYSNVMFEIYIYNSLQEYPDSDLIKTLYDDVIYDRNSFPYIE
jgi:hypothetical protein